MWRLVRQNLQVNKNNVSVKQKDKVQMIFLRTVYYAIRDKIKFQSCLLKFKKLWRSRTTYNKNFINLKTQNIIKQLCKKKCNSWFTMQLEGCSIIWNYKDKKILKNNIFLFSFNLIYRKFKPKQKICMIIGRTIVYTNFEFDTTCEKKINIDICIKKKCNLFNFDKQL